MEEVPGGRRLIRESSCIPVYLSVRRENVRRLSSQRLYRIGCTVENRNGGKGEQLSPVFPARKLQQIVRAHDPDEFFLGKTVYQGFQGIHGVARPQSGFDVGYGDPAVLCDRPRDLEPVFQRRHSLCFLEGVLW